MNLFQFYPAFRKCPSCGSSLLTSTLVTKLSMQGPLERMGVVCYCVSCNRRYRATGRISYPPIAWLGPVARRLWWRTASLELTVRPDF